VRLATTAVIEHGIGVQRATDPHFSRRPSPASGPASAPRAGCAGATSPTSRSRPFDGTPNPNSSV
jgi:hypothetical protein